MRSSTRLELVTETVRAARKSSPTPTHTCWPAWSTRSEGAATAVRSALARTPPGPRPGSTPPATAPSGCWSISGSTGQTYPTSSLTAAPLIVARCTKGQCQPGPVRTRCTTSRENARNVSFPPRELRDLQVRIRAEQQTPDWQARSAVRSGVEGTANEFAHGHGMRRCRCREQPKSRLQHVFTAIAVNIERLSGLPSTGETHPSRPPTAFQDFLDQHGFPRLKSCRAVSRWPRHRQD
ncbi:transposase, partial [Streptomyces mirabilis]|uniref:transposase n=1 Tax=Streptomyces mirabilis TaxID=68239 RepID=UPI0033ACED72